jgi:transposase
MAMHGQFGGNLQVFAASTNAARADAMLTHWMNWARRCRLAPFKRLGATIKNHLAGIIEHFRSGLGNGFAEALNGRVQAAACVPSAMAPMRI